MQKQWFYFRTEQKPIGSLFASNLKRDYDTTMAIEKKANAKNNTVKVTFKLPAEAVQENGAVVGEFNGWDPAQTPLKFVKSGQVWKAEATVEGGKSYQFRYFVDGTWRNDESADDYVPNEFFSENSVVNA